MSIIICYWCARYFLIEYMIHSSRTNTHFTTAQKKILPAYLLRLTVKFNTLKTYFLSLWCFGPLMGNDFPLSRLRHHKQTHYTRQESSGRGTYTWQHTTLTRDRPPCPLGEIRTRNTSMQVAADPPRGHCDQHSVTRQLLVLQSFRTHFERINWIFQLRRGKYHKKFLYIACKLLEFKHVQ